MKSVFMILLTLFTLSVYAGVSEDVLITGKVGSEFDDIKVKVTDSLGQTYFLSKTHFSQDFKFRQGEPFTIQLNEQEFENIEILNKKGNQ